MKQKISLTLALLLGIVTLIGVYLLQQGGHTQADMPKITWREFQELTTEQRTNLVYIGRDNCPDCRKYQPRLQKIAQEKKVPVYYYDIINDRKKNEFKKTIKKLDLQEVPALYLIGQKQIRKLDPQIIETPAFDQAIKQYQLNKKE